MKAFVTGGTGAIGGHAVAALVAHGHAVAALAVAFAGQDAVVNLTSSIPPMHKFMDTTAWQANDRVRTLAAAVGTPAWLRVPGRAALLLGDRSTSLTRSVRASNARFRAATGWAPRDLSAREGYAATVAALAARDR
jgi:nucleoside-diphosphate-sugar epimerase